MQLGGSINKETLLYTSDLIYYFDYLFYERLNIKIRKSSAQNEN